MIGDADWIRSALERVAAIPSLSGSERQAQEEVERLMREAGATVRRVPVDAVRLRERFGFSSPTPTDGMYSVVGSWGPAGADEFVVLNGHIDTVAAGDDWSVDPLDPVTADGSITGLGAADMKAGLISAIAAAARAASSGRLSRRVEVQSVPDEEAGGGTGTMACVDELLVAGRLPDLAIVGEPTGLAVATAQVGSRSIRARLTGVSAHSNTKSAGASAVEAGMELAAVLLTWADDPARRPHPLLPSPSVNVGKMVGGTGATTVASDAELEFCFTYAPADTAALLTETEALIAEWRSRQDERIGVEFVELHNVQPFEVDPALPAAVRLRAAADRPADETAGFPAGSDGRLLANLLGAPTLIFGPGDIRRIHRADESIELAEVLRHAQSLTAFLLDPRPLSTK